ncbi:hypothetical protein Ancab_036446, partial [Ancistrocladus abbreviatus]
VAGRHTTCAAGVPHRVQSVAAPHSVVGVGNCVRKGLVPIVVAIWEQDAQIMEQIM